MEGRCDGGGLWFFGFGAYGGAPAGTLFCDGDARASERGLAERERPGRRRDRSGPPGRPGRRGALPRSPRSSPWRSRRERAGVRLNTVISVPSKAIPSETRKLGRILLDQQMWCFGRDVSRAAGNVLVARGFSKETPPEDMSASSRYVWREPERGREIRLWGFGIVYGEKEPDALYLERRKFAPRLVPEKGCVSGVWRASEMPRCRMPRTEAETAAAWRLLAGVSAWLSEYEAWVRSEFGAGYRRRCVSSWPKKSTPADAMPETWASLASFFERGEPVPAGHLD